MLIPWFFVLQFGLQTFVSRLSPASFASCKTVILSCFPNRMKWLVSGVASLLSLVPNCRPIICDSNQLDCFKLCEVNALSWDATLQVFPTRRLADRVSAFVRDLI